MPFQWNFFKGEPAFMRRYVGIDEEGTEESMQAWEEKGKIGKAGMLDLEFGLTLCFLPLQVGEGEGEVRTR